MTATAHPTLRQATGPAYTRVLAYGAARGEVSVPNEALIGPIDSSDEWIQQRTGIITRMRAEHDTDAIDLATAAGDDHCFSAEIAHGMTPVGSRFHPGNGEGGTGN